MPYARAEMLDSGVVYLAYSYRRKDGMTLIPAYGNPAEYMESHYPGNSPLCRFLKHSVDIPAISLGRFMRYIDSIL